MSLGRGVGMDGLRASVVSSGPSLISNENHTHFIHVCLSAISFFMY